MLDDLTDAEVFAYKSARGEAQRAANDRAAARGEPLPYPNFWDLHDPTKVQPGASAEEVHQRYLEFRKRCRTPLKRHTI